VRNALDAAMRDALIDALAVAEAEPTLAVELAGAGAGFCSGGDLDEFGTLADPASAHRLRLDRSVGLVLAGLADRTTALVHGASAGSGVELAAFAGRVVAAPDATFELPELSMGLVPGAGGTVSVTARTGRHRCAWLALTGERIDAPTALAWGLVDEVDQDGPAPDLEGTRG
jgi:enoyl-CoA hydratase/carnithine racemase